MAEATLFFSFSRRSVAAPQNRKASLCRTDGTAQPNAVRQWSRPPQTESHILIHKSLLITHSYIGEVIILFAILQFSDTNTIFRQPKIESKRYSLPSGDAFFIVTAERHLGRIPWKKLEKCLDILRKDILLPEGITVPPDINITAFTPDILPHLLLINSATDYIRNHKESFKDKSLTIFDEKAVYQSYIEKLLPYFHSIKIITDQPDSYENLSQKLLQNYGFSLLISNEEVINSDVVISHQMRVPLYFNGTVFTNEKQYLMNGEVLSGSEINITDIYESIRPENIGRVLFASALYEKSKEYSLGKLKYNDFGS